MKTKTITVAFAVALVGAAGFAFANSSSAPPNAAPPSALAPAAAAPEAPQHAVAPPLDSSQLTGDLPPNHPSIDSIGAAAGGASPHSHGGADPHGGIAPGAAPAEAPALTWKVDAAWPTRPNPSSMRLETHAVPHVGSDADDAELAITRAGGDVDANVSRWEGQFANGPAPERKDLTVHGLSVASVKIEGTFSGGMGQAAGTHPDWAMLGAIVSAPGESYFFKLTGPRATVLGARAKFDALVQSVAKK